MAKGTLEQELAEAVDQTLQAMQEDEEDGMLPDEAWEANQERYHRHNRAEAQASWTTIHTYHLSSHISV